MSEPSSGLRLVTPLSFLAHKQARAYSAAPPAITRLAALKVVKRAAPALGLKGVKLAVIDALFAFSQPQDWADAASRPLIWPSNASLAARLGLSVAALKHHLRGLRHVGLIACSDHPTYQRRGGRDASGRIAEAFGIDLSPIAMRFSELQALAEAHEAEMQRRRTLGRERTVLRRQIAAIFESASREAFSAAAFAASDWPHLQARLDCIHERKAVDSGSLEPIVQDLEMLLEDSEDAYDALVRGQNLTPAVTEFSPLQNTNNHSNFVSCNTVPERAQATESDTGAKPDRHRLAETEQHGMKTGDNRAGERMAEPSGGMFAAPVDRKILPVAEKCEAVFGQTTRKIVAKTGQGMDQMSHPAAEETGNAGKEIKISLPLVAAACRTTAELAPEAFSSWRSLTASSQLLCRFASISPEAWREARESLGAELGATALALTIQRASDGKVANPGGYLRALARRHRSGQLHLNRSLIALARAA